MDYMKIVLVHGYHFNPSIRSQIESLLNTPKIFYREIYCEGGYTLTIVADRIVTSDLASQLVEAIYESESPEDNDPENPNAPVFVVKNYRPKILKTTHDYFFKFLGGVHGTYEDSEKLYQE